MSMMSGGKMGGKGMSMMSGGKMGGGSSKGKGMSMMSKGKGMGKSKGMGSSDDYYPPPSDDYPTDDGPCCEKWMVHCEDSYGGKMNKGKDQICKPYCAVPCSGDDDYGKFTRLQSC